MSKQMKPTDDHMRRNKFMARKVCSAAGGLVGWLTLTQYSALPAAHSPSGDSSWTYVPVRYR